MMLRTVGFFLLLSHVLASRVKVQHLTSLNVTDHTEEDDSSQTLSAVPIALPIILYQMYSTGAIYYYAGSLLVKTGLKAHEHLTKHWDNLADRVVPTALQMFERMSTGNLSTTELVHNEYLQLQLMRSDLTKIDNYCKRMPGFVDWLVQWSLPSEETSSNISAKIAEINAVFGAASEHIFCEHFLKGIETHLAEMTRIIVDWETKTGRLWRPRTLMPNRYLVGIDVDDGAMLAQRAKDLLMTEDELKTAVLKGTRWAMRANGGPNLWLHQWTTLEDSIMSDPNVAEATKAKFQRAIQQTRMLFKEVSGMEHQGEVKQCRLRGEELQKNQICQICQWCCQMPHTEPHLFDWLYKKMYEAFSKSKSTKVAGTSVEALMINAMDASSAGFILITQSVTSMLSFAARLGTTAFKKQTCEQVLLLLNQQELPDEARMEELKWLTEKALSRAEEDQTQVETALPQPGDDDCHNPGDCGDALL